MKKNSTAYFDAANGQEFSIRQANYFDAISINFLCRACFPGNAFKDFRTNLDNLLPMMMKNRDFPCLIAETTSGGTAGCVILDVKKPWIGASQYGIGVIAVSPGFRKLGIGRMLLSEAETLIRKLNREKDTRVVAEINTDNNSSLALFQAAGYRPLRTIEAFYDDGGSALFLEKHLGGPEAKPESARVIPLRPSGPGGI